MYCPYNSSKCREEACAYWKNNKCMADNTKRLSQELKEVFVAMRNILGRKKREEIIYVDD